MIRDNVPPTVFSMVLAFCDRAVVDAHRELARMMVAHDPSLADLAKHVLGEVYSPERMAPAVQERYRDSDLFDDEDAEAAA